MSRGVYGYTYFTIYLTGVKSQWGKGLKNKYFFYKIIILTNKRYEKIKCHFRI